MAEARIFYQQDCDIHKLDGKTVAIIGYGSQCQCCCWSLRRQQKLGKG